MPEIEKDLENLKNDFWAQQSPKFLDKSNPFQVVEKSPILPKKMAKYQKVHQSLEKQ